MTGRRRLLRLTWITVFALIVLAFPSVCKAQGPVVVSVDEEWALQIGAPNQTANSPQISMVVSPTGDIQSDYFMFVLNHRTHPTYQPGGLQVQQWSGQVIQDRSESSDDSTLDNTGEIVRWTQKMSISNGMVTFEIKSGTSTSWGAFGDDPALSMIADTGQSDLSAYTESVSLAQSGVSYGGNRVTSLSLLKVTWTLSDGSVYTSSAPVEVDIDVDP